MLAMGLHDLCHTALFWVCLVCRSEHAFYANTFLMRQIAPVAWVSSIDTECILVQSIVQAGVELVGVPPYDNQLLGEDDITFRDVQLVTLMHTIWAVD